MVIGHNYSVAGTYDVKVCVTDKDNDTGCNNLVIGVGVITGQSPRSLIQEALDNVSLHTGEDYGFIIASSRIQTPTNHKSQILSTTIVGVLDALGCECGGIY